MNSTHKAAQKNVSQPPAPAPSDKTITNAPSLTDKRSWQTFLYIGILAVTYLVVYNYTLSETIYMGGDNLLYYYLGKSLASGQGFTDIITPLSTPHNHYPPGYPFLMSLFMRMGANGIPFFCVLNGIFGCICVILCYFFTQKISRDRNLAFAVSLLLAVLPAFLGSAQVTMSEIPGTLFGLIAICIVAWSRPEAPVLKDRHFWLALVCMVIAYYIRTSAIALLAAAVVFYLLRRQWQKGLIILVGFIACALPWQLRTQRLGGSNYVRAFMAKNPYRMELGKATSADFGLRIVANLKRYISLEIPNALAPNLFPEMDDNYVPQTYWLPGIILTALMFYGMFRLMKKQPLAVLYMLAGGGILLIWPDVWTGSRFMLPLLPFIILAILYGLNELLRPVFRRLPIGWNPAVLGIAGVLLTIPSLKKIHNELTDTYAPNFQSYISAAEWSREHLPETAMFACRKPEIFYYFAERRCMQYKSTEDASLLLDDLKKNHIGYVIIDQLGFSSTARYLVPAVQKNPGKFRILYQSPPPETYVLAFTP